MRLVTAVNCSDFEIRSFNNLVLLLSMLIYLQFIKGLVQRPLLTSNFGGKRKPGAIDAIPHARSGE